MKEVKYGIQLCESPLELKLARELIKIPGFVARKMGDDPSEIGSMPGWLIHVLAQVQIGKYRADLALAPAAMNEGPDGWALVIEVDGHEFHERTMEQARRDRSRDRFMLTHQINVMRFTGQEVHQDAAACALEAYSFAVTLQRPRMTRMFDEWLERAAAQKGGLQ